MRDNLRCFEGEDKTIGNLICPPAENSLGWHMIEGIVDFYRVEMCRVEMEHFPGRNLFRIEYSLPFLVAVAACTDIDFHGLSPLFIPGFLALHLTSGFVLAHS
jgi:hypothetical protein